MTAFAPPSSDRVEYYASLFKAHREHLRQQRTAKTVTRVVPPKPVPKPLVPVENPASNLSTIVDTKSEKSSGNNRCGARVTTVMNPTERYSVTHQFIARLATGLPEEEPVPPPAIVPCELAAIAPPIATTENLPEPLEPDDEPNVYLPTPEQIREECLAIQAGWSKQEFRLRARGFGLGEHRMAPYTIPVVKGGFR